MFGSIFNRVFAHWYQAIDTAILTFISGTHLAVKVGDWICFNSPTNEKDEWEHCRITETHLFPVIKVTVSTPFGKKPRNHRDYRSFRFVSAHAGDL